MDLHLRIVDSAPATIDIYLHAADNPAAEAALTYRRVAYDEVGGEALNVSRVQTGGTLTRAAVDELRRLLPRGRLPPPANPPMGLDGCTYSLTIGSGPHAVEYEWWTQLPVEWECLRPIVRLLLAGAGVTGTADDPKLN